jgi:hypothetical protein
MLQARPAVERCSHSVATENICRIFVTLINCSPQTHIHTRNVFGSSFSIFFTVAPRSSSNTLFSPHHILHARLSDCIYTSLFSSAGIGLFGRRTRQSCAIAAAVSRTASTVRRLYECGQPSERESQCSVVVYGRYDSGAQGCRLR